ncbi:MAG: hypothetical protein IJD17_03740 [Clostridia bacterium]|nr:hypothetical protein [Clostridia bacterium]
MTKSRIYAVTDVGSNTVKCSVYRVTNGRIEDIEFMSEKVGLIARVENNTLPDPAITLLCNTVSGYRKRAEELGADRFCIFGTAIMRRIDNFGAVSRTLKERIGVEIDLISGEEEAQLSFTGARLVDGDVRTGVMADLGGASTELIAFEGDGITDLHSFPFGCLYLYDRFVKGRFPSADERAEITDFVSRELAKYPITAVGRELILIGGTGKAIRKLLCKFGYDGRRNSVSVLDELADRLSRPDEKDIALLERTIPSRVETVIPGLLAYVAAAKATDSEFFTVSDGGIREGYLKKLMAEEL